MAPRLGIEPSSHRLTVWPHALCVTGNEFLAGRRGFEPRLPDSKSGVLPLDERPTGLVEHSGIEPDDGNLARIARYPIDVPRGNFCGLTCLPVVDWWTNGNRTPTSCVQNRCAPVITIGPRAWCAREGLNLRPSACRAATLPLSYARALFLVPGTGIEPVLTGRVKTPLYQ